MLFHVYDEPKPEGYYAIEPVDLYRTLLDADWLLYVLPPLLLAIVVGLMMLAWRLHEIPAHKADKKRMRQAELVSALTLLGLFEHWVWAVALFIAFVDWDVLEDALVRILRRANTAEAGEVQAPPPTAETQRAAASGQAAAATEAASTEGGKA